MSYVVGDETFSRTPRVLFFEYLFLHSVLDTREKTSFSSGSNSAGFY